MKIRTRLTLMFAITVATLVFIFSLATYVAAYLYRQSEFYGRLKDKAQTTAELLLGTNDVTPEVLKIVDAYDLTALYHEEVTIFTRNRKMVYDSGRDQVKIPDEVFKSVALGQDVWFEAQGREVIGTLWREGKIDYMVIASAEDKWGNTLLSNLLLSLTIAWAVAVVISVWLGFIFSSRALQPISNIMQQVDSIGETNLNARVRTANNKDEIAHLASTFNRMLARLEEAFMLSKSFVANASHELRTPLTSITGQIEVTLLQERSAEDYKAVLQSVMEDMHSLNKLTNDLLTLTQTGADIASFRLNPMRVDEIMWQARMEVLRAHPNYQIQIDFSNFPEDEEQLLVNSNEPLLRTAFANLMDNGCKYSPDKQVKVSLSNTNNTLKIEFADQGIGISEKDIRNITEPFFRGENARSFSGHGIGLALTGKIVFLHRGNLKVHSIVNKGTTFSISLPEYEPLD
ncbi:MAG: HAMP domain-containing sensor histidine kinase [Bacteroidota bacterium]